MSNEEKNLQHYLDATEQKMTIHKAPDFSGAIWKRHQAKKATRNFALAASVSVLCLTVWLQNSLPSTPSLIAQNQLLERELAKVVDNNLPERQRLIMEGWQYELALIDQDLELYNNNGYDESLWSRRTNLLTKMVEFYVKPIDFYEI